MTRRERLERKADRLKKWAESAREKASALLAQGDPLRRDHAFLTQPGYIPERARMHRRTERAAEYLEKVREHERRAHEIERQLENTIFDDDPDAVEQLEARILEREETAGRYREINRAWRKGGAEAVVAAGLMTEDGASRVREVMAGAPWLKAPLDTRSLRAAIRRDRQRIARLENDGRSA